ncbi:MAG: ABC transporter permease [Acidimicrobiales bacterium]|nr:ABC transporter permease [Acidimicrobiales bacterium]
MSTVDTTIPTSATPGTSAARGSNSLGRDTSLVFMRELQPLLRDSFSVLFTLVQPVFFLALFGPLLARSTGLGTADALQWFVPGIIVMSALFGASTTGANLILEMQSGSHERMLVAPLHRSALLLGRAAKEVVPTLMQSLILVAVTIPFGFRLEAAGILIGLPLVAAFAVGLGALSHALAIATRKNDWMFWMVQQTLLFPLMILSGMLLPLDDAPRWMEVLSNVNPLTHVVDAERLLFAGEVTEAAVARGAVAAVAVLAIGLWVGIRAVSRNED